MIRLTASDPEFEIAFAALVDARRDADATTYRATSPQSCRAFAPKATRRCAT